MDGRAEFGGGRRCGDRARPPIWPSESRWLGAIRAELLALTEDDLDDVVLAVNEAASNSIEHAYAPGTLDGTVEVTFWTEHRGFSIQILDHGPWREPSGATAVAVAGS